MKNKQQTMILGITLVVLGISSTIAGVVIISKNQDTPVVTQIIQVQEPSSVDTVVLVPEEAQKSVNAPSQALQSTVETVKEEVESTTVSDKEKGDNFEKYIVQKFSKKYFTLLEWASDKYVNGHYAESNKHPDLSYKFAYKDLDVNFAVECKFRSDYYKNGIEWCTNQQLSNYRNYANDTDKSVFVVIGVGGDASEPEELYIIPLTEINSNFVSKSFLQSYKKNNFKDSNLFYDYKSNLLK